MDRNVLRNLSYGMYMIGAKDGLDNVGCIVNTVVQITSNPFTIMVSIHHDNYTNEIVGKTKRFGVSILGEDVSLDVIGMFGYKSSRDVNKFENVHYKEVDGVPILDNSCGNMICRVIDSIETSTHTVFVAEILDMFGTSTSRPMTYRYYHEILKGESPKNAPTYIEDDKKEKTSEKKTIWKCSVCGYEVEMDELPDDYVCPVCGESVEVFKKFNS